MEYPAQKPTAPTDSAQIANLKREDARIRLQWARFATKGSAVVLFAPSVVGIEQLLKAAVHELGVKATYLDTTSVLDMSGLTDVLRDATTLIVFDDEAFREAAFSMLQVVNARRKRRDLHPLVVRVGEPTDDDDDLEAHLIAGECLHLKGLDDWTQVPLFLMEGIFKQASRRRTPD